MSTPDLSGAQPLCLLIALDGATLDLVLPGAASGELPALAGLLERGAWGPLASTIPPASFPAWSTMMSGANPGRHGIFDFTQRLPGRYEIAFINATYRRLPSLWQRLRWAGRRTAALGFPATYPPEAVHGLMVSGFDSPVTTGIDRHCVYPPERYREIAPYPLSGIQEVRIGPGWHEQALERMLRSIERRTEIALGLLGQEPWDLFAIHYGESDTVAHHFWAFHDPRSPRYDPAGAARCGDAVRQVYRALDRALGRLVMAVPEATVVVVSDHGTGGAGEWVVHLNRWLAEHGWLRFTAGRGARRLSGALRQAGLRLPPTVQAWAFRGPLRAWVNRLESGNRLGGIDWRQTAAFSEEVNTLPGIWLNVAGREALGTLAPAEYESLRDEICAALQTWLHPETGAPLLRRAWRREELYQGPWVHLAPDIVLEPALDRGYSITFLSSGGQPGPALRPLGPSERLGAKGGSMNGSHRPEGLLILAGRGIRPGVRLTGARLEDIAPTVLAMLGLPGPSDLDGRVLAEAFVPGARPEARSSPEPGVTPLPQPYSAEEEALVQERLRRLGYRD